MYKFHIFFIHFSADKHPACVPSLAVVNCDAINRLHHYRMTTLTLPGVYPRDEPAGSIEISLGFPFLGMSVLISLELSLFTFSPKIYKSFFSPTTFPALVISPFFIHIRLPSCQTTYLQFQSLLSTSYF